MHMVRMGTVSTYVILSQSLMNIVVYKAFAHPLLNKSQEWDDYIKDTNIW